MNIIGISAFYHESACCLLQDGHLVAAAAEERFTRVKHDARLPSRAFRYCLDEGGLCPGDIDCIAYFENPKEKLSRQTWAHSRGRRANDVSWRDPNLPEHLIRDRLGYDGAIDFFDHHLSHAASAFFYSGYGESAVLSVDGVGEWITTAYGQCAQNRIDLFEQVSFPHSLGLLYSTITAYLGFKVNDGEYKVMGLAPYGTLRYVDQVRKLVNVRPNGQFELALEYFDFIAGPTMYRYSEAFCDLFGQPARRHGDDLTQFHKDIARSAQAVLEEVLLDKVSYLHRTTESKNLCLAGGVALNSVANGRIIRESPFENVFIPPAPGDAGACLGAAVLAYTQRTGNAPTQRRLSRATWGPKSTSLEIKQLLADSSLNPESVGSSADDLDRAVVELLIEGKVVGWFQGSMEFGQRALGGRSILADPRRPDMQDKINRVIKQRERFRPFAPSVLEEHESEHFDLSAPSPFMSQTCKVISPLELPAVTHVDGSARPQTVNANDAPRFARLLRAFQRRTGCPMLLNTSMNSQGEPIVNSPADALRWLILSGADALVLDDVLILRESQPANLGSLIRATWPDGATSDVESRNPVGENLYSFV